MGSVNQGRQSRWGVTALLLLKMAQINLKGDCLQLEEIELLRVGRLRSSPTVHYCGASEQEVDLIWILCTSFCTSFAQYLTVLKGIWYKCVLFYDNIIASYLWFLVFRSLFHPLFYLILLVKIWEVGRWAVSSPLYRWETWSSVRSPCASSVTCIQHTYLTKVSCFFVRIT